MVLDVGRGRTEDVIQPVNASRDPQSRVDGDALNIRGAILENAVAEVPRSRRERTVRLGGDGSREMRHAVSE